MQQCERCKTCRHFDNQPEYKRSSAIPKDSKLGLCAAAMRKGVGDYTHIYVPDIVPHQPSIIVGENFGCVLHEKR